MSYAQSGSAAPKAKNFSIAKGFCFGLTHALTNLLCTVQLYLGGALMAALTLFLALQFLAMNMPEVANEFHHFFMTFDYNGLAAGAEYLAMQYPDVFFVLFGLFLASFYGGAALVARKGGLLGLLLPLSTALRTILGFLVATVVVVAFAYVGYYTVGVLAFYWVAQYAFYAHALADKKVGPLDALKKSEDLVAGSPKWQMLFLTVFFAFFLPNPDFRFCFAIVALMPVFAMMHLQVYDTLKK